MDALYEYVKGHTRVSRTMPVPITFHSTPLHSTHGYTEADL